MPRNLATAIHFGSFAVTPQVFYTSRLSFALVNLKPLLPGHVLVSPRRVVPRFKDLSPDEVADLFATVQRVGNVVSRLFQADALNIAVQDGAAAGQSVPHVHAHIIPRHAGDLDARGGTDAIYGMLEGPEGDIGRQLGDAGGAQTPDAARPRPQFARPDAQRAPRSAEEMAAEADWLAKEMDAPE